MSRLRVRWARRASPPPLLAGHRAGLASVSRAPGDGVSYVARLLERALADLAGMQPWLVDLAPSRPGVVSTQERIRFTARLAAGQASGRVDWLVYNHLGIARAQRTIPSIVRKPYGVFVHGIEVWDGALSAERRAVLRDATVRIANSHFTARRIEELHADVGVVEPCPLGLLPPDDTTAEPVDEALLARVGPRAALIVGRMDAMERYKGHDELIECWPLVRSAVPDAQLVVAGGGTDLERLRAKVAAAGLDDAILFAGRVSGATLNALFGRAALFAMPSRGEGFGLVYLEAMRAGLPCIGSTEDAAGEVIVDGETGLLVPQRDRAALADALRVLLLDPARRRALGAAGRARYEYLYTYERFRDRLGAILVRTIAARDERED